MASWDVSNVTNMQSMFMYSISGTLTDLTNWNVSNVTHMGNV